MIQLSFTNDLHTPVAVWFDSLQDETPTEYLTHFHKYEYLNDSEALAMLEDEFVTDDTKKALSEALPFDAVNLATNGMRETRQFCKIFENIYKFNS
jgi:hypothetical protein